MSSPIALFAWLISRTFSVNEQYFSFTTNQLTVLFSHGLAAKRTGRYSNADCRVGVETGIKG